MAAHGARLSGGRPSAGGRPARPELEGPDFLSLPHWNHIAGAFRSAVSADGADSLQLRGRGPAVEGESRAVTDHRAAYDDGQLPWLQAVEDEDEPRGVSARKMLAALGVVLLAGLLVAGTFFWLGRRDTAVIGPPELIHAPPGPYKVKPPTAGGLDIAGESETAVETSAGSKAGVPDAQGGGRELLRRAIERTDEGRDLRPGRARAVRRRTALLPRRGSGGVHPVQAQLRRPAAATSADGLAARP